MNKARMWTAVYNDYVSIKTVRDLEKRKLTHIAYKAIPAVFNEYKKCGEGKTFIKGTADYFKRFGFSISLDENRTHYVIA